MRIKPSPNNQPIKMAAINHKMGKTDRKDRGQLMKLQATTKMTSKKMNKNMKRKSMEVTKMRTVTENWYDKSLRNDEVKLHALLI